MSTVGQIRTSTVRAWPRAATVLVAMPRVSRRAGTGRGSAQRPDLACVLVVRSPSNRAFRTLRTVLYVLLTQRRKDIRRTSVVVQTFHLTAKTLFAKQ